MVAPVTCTVQSGGNRRVIHLEFASERLPGGLEWNALMPLH
jgi:hypothetical protein